MPSFKGDIEQTAANRFLLEAETGFPLNRKLIKTYATFDEAHQAQKEFHDQHLAPKPAPPPSPEDLATAAGERAAQQPFSMASFAVPEPPAPSARGTLIAEATERGINVDRRWSEATLGTKIAEHDAAASVALEEALIRRLQSVPPS